MATGETLLSEPAVEESTRGRDDSSVGETLNGAIAEPTVVVASAPRGRRVLLIVLAVAAVAAFAWWFARPDDAVTSRIGSEAAGDQALGGQLATDDGPADDSAPSDPTTRIGSAVAAPDPGGDLGTGSEGADGPAGSTANGDDSPSGVERPDPDADDADGGTSTTADPAVPTTSNPIDPTAPTVPSTTAAPTTTAPTTTSTSTTTTVVPTTPVPTTAAPTTTTTAAPTTQPPSTSPPQPCQIVVSSVANLKEEARSGSRTLTVASAGTYSASARSGTLWYQVVANGEQGWLRATGSDVPTGDCDTLLLAAGPTAGATSDGADGPQ